MIPTQREAAGEKSHGAIHERKYYNEKNLWADSSGFGRHVTTNERKEINGIKTNAREGSTPGGFTVQKMKEKRTMKNSSSSPWCFRKEDFQVSPIDVCIKSNDSRAKAVLTPGS